MNVFCRTDEFLWLEMYNRVPLWWKKSLIAGKLYVYNALWVRSYPINLIERGKANSRNQKPNHYLVIDIR